jgi:hypothetical protein
MPRRVLLLCVIFGVCATPASASVPYTIADFAGTGAPGAPTPGSAAASELQGPWGDAVDSAGNVYIADHDNNVVEKVTPSGTLSIIGGNGSSGVASPGPATGTPIQAPSAIAVDGAGNVYVTEETHAVVLKITPSGTLSIVAGDGVTGAPTPGPATSSSLSGPEGVAVDAAGDLFIGDDGNQLVEKVTPSGTLSIYAGSGASGAPVPGPATASPLSDPTGIAVTPGGTVYIGDYDESEILKVTPDGTLSVVAGNGTWGVPTDGPAATSEIGEPYELALDAADNLYVADWDVVFEITPAGALTVLAGNGGWGAPTYGVTATSTQLAGPAGVGVTPAGRVYIADAANNTIDLLVPPAVANMTPPSLSGTAAIGQTLSTDGGTWSNSPNLLTYDWQLCDANGANCVDIPGATGATYAVTTGESGHTVRVLVSADNGAGPVTQASAVSAVIPGAPVPAAPPAPAAPAPVAAPIATLLSATVRPAGDSVTARVTVPTAGTVDGIATEADPATWASAASMSAGRGRFAYATGSGTMTAAGTYTLKFHLTPHGRAIIRRHHSYGWMLHVRVTIAFHPAGGGGARSIHKLEIFPARRR